MTLSDPYEELRRNMVAHQIAARGVKDTRVLEAMLAVRRHEFVGAANADLAYADQPLPIGLGQTISQPYIVARMTELLEVKPQHLVLEVGAGCGYQTAVLCRLCAHVFAIERLPELAALAQVNLRRAQCGNYSLSAGDGAMGWPEHAPFDRALVACAAARIPEALLEQLKIGGRLVAPIGDPQVQELILAVKQADGQVKISTHGSVRFVPMV